MDKEYLCFLDSTSVQNTPNSQRIIMDPCDPPKELLKTEKGLGQMVLAFNVNCNSCLLFTSSTRTDEFALILTWMINFENIEAQNLLKKAMNNLNLIEDYIKL